MAYQREVAMKRLSIVRVAHANGITIAELARRLGISDRTLSHRINNNPRVETLYEIAEIIGCDITDLFI